MPFLKYPGGKRHQVALISKLFADSGKACVRRAVLWLRGRRGGDCGGLLASRRTPTLVLVSTLFMAIQSPDFYWWKGASGLGMSSREKRDTTRRGEIELAAPQPV